MAQEPAASSNIPEKNRRSVQEPIETHQQRERRTLAAEKLQTIGLLLSEFATDYGSYPDEKTALAVKQVTESRAIVQATTANDCFFQLYLAGLISAQTFLGYQPFSLEPPISSDFRNPPPLLKLEKCEFAYLPGPSRENEPTRPVVVVPLLQSRTTFDPAILGGKALVLRADMRIETYPIETDGRVLVNGKDLFDPAQPFWKGKAPVIRWQEN